MKLSFFTLRFGDNLKFVAFSGIPFSTESFKEEEFSESDDKDSSDISLFPLFLLFLCLSVSCAAKVRTI